VLEDRIRCAYYSIQIFEKYINKLIGQPSIKHESIWKSIAKSIKKNIVKQCEETSYFYSGVNFVSTNLTPQDIVENVIWNDRS
jgi:hypothetical protein